MWNHVHKHCLHLCRIVLFVCVIHLMTCVHYCKTLCLVSIQTAFCDFLYFQGEMCATPDIFAHLTHLLMNLAGGKLCAVLEVSLLLSGYRTRTH